MRVILDECLPRRLKREIAGHVVTTVSEAGWASIKNGQLLRLIAGSYDAFVTVDKNLPSQQSLGTLPFGVIIIRAKSNRIADLKHFGPLITTELRTLAPGQVVRLP